ncbi:protein of unknown function [Burkholderia multivorans]
MRMRTGDSSAGGVVKYASSGPTHRCQAPMQRRAAEWGRQYTSARIDNGRKALRHFIGFAKRYIENTLSRNPGLCDEYRQKEFSRQCLRTTGAGPACDCPAKDNSGDRTLAFHIRIHKYNLMYLIDS